LGQQFKQTFLSKRRLNPVLRKRKRKRERLRERKREMREGEKGDSITEVLLFIFCL
jgi:hypothetical protein